MSQSLPCSHSNKTSLPQPGSHRITMVFDKGHWDGMEKDGRQQCSCKGIAVAFLLDSALSQAQSSNTLICTSHSHYFVYGFQGRRCLNLQLSHSKLLTPSNDVLDAAVEEALGTGMNDGLPTVVFLHSPCLFPGVAGVL